MRSHSAWLLFFLLLIISLVIPPASVAAKISDYRPDFSPYVDANGKEQLAIRTFTRDGVPFKLLIDPHNLTTSLASAQTLKPVTGFHGEQFSGIQEATASPPFRLQNQGLKHATTQVTGMFLTVDLCPSKRSFEKRMFEELSATALKTGRPVPVAICITGAWLASHPTELQWLKEQESKGSLTITWVNHSLSHFYDPALPLERNFMLASGTDPRVEILDNEIAMLQAGITPSPFFRFPGLVSDEKLVRLLHELHLIPLGADAWLAKGEEPKDGSIILVHGNGNESPGIVKLMKLLQTSSPPQFLPLAKAVVPGRRK